MKAAVPVETRPSNEIPSSEVSHDVQKTVQRESLKIAEPFRTVQEQPDLPVVQREQSPDSVQREMLKSAQPVNTSSASDLSANAIQRDFLPGADISQNPGLTKVPAEASVIQREPDSDMTSLLQSLPTC